MSNTRTSSVPSVSRIIEMFAENDGNAREVIISAYRMSEKGDKSRITANVRKAFEKAFDDNMSDSVVRAIRSVKSELAETPEKAAIDPIALVGTNVRIHLEAAIALMSGKGDYSGLPDDADIPTFGDESDIQTIRDMIDEWDLPAIPDEKVQKHLSVRIGRKGKENHIPDMIRTSCESVDSGTFLSISDILAHMAAKYPEKGIDGKWHGRVAAALFVNNDAKGVEGFISVHEGKGGRNGAIVA